VASPVESQHSAHRILTPAPFAKWLVARVRYSHKAERVAALYVACHGPYPTIANVECWPLWAERYNGPWPIIAHPPCGPWGPARTLCKYQTKQGGIDAIELVHRFGGVIEQPIRSTLFDLHGRGGAVVEIVNQKDFGHPIEKPTKLYWVAH
jgi:hypothetical protein